MNKFFVQGDSMSPLLREGDEVEVEPADNFSVDDVVVVRHPFKKSVLLVKRVHSLEKGGYDLRGDNPKDSTDSRTLGLFAKERILGKVRPL